jgi:hypothetical protein
MRLESCQHACSFVKGDFASTLPVCIIAFAGHTKLLEIDQAISLDQALHSVDNASSIVMVVKLNKESYVGWRDLICCEKPSYR